MALPVYTVGQVLNASDANLWFVPLVIVKPGDTGRNTTTTPTADPDLTIALAINCTYRIDGRLLITGPSAAGVKWNFSVPASSTGFWSAMDLGGLGTAYGANQAYSTISTSVAVDYGIRAIVATAGSTGNFTLNWAQNSSNGTNTTVKANSLFSIRRIA
jgi:hypothetical protein